MRARICAFFLATICCLTALAGALPNEYNSWVLIRTPNFTVMTNDRPRHAQEIARRLEILRYLFSKLHPEKRLNASVPTYVYVFKSDNNFEPYKPLVEGKPANISGFFLRSFDANFVALSSHSPREVIFHEYIHYFMDINLTEIPLWYAEGMAEYYSTLDVEGNVAQIGRVHDRHVEGLRATTLMPLEELFATGKDSPNYNEVGKQGKFYAQSWALVHYMHLGDNSLVPKLADYLGRLETGEENDVAFRAAFETDPATLLQALKEYVQAGNFKAVSLTFENLDVDTGMTHETLDRAEGRNPRREESLEHVPGANRARARPRRPTGSVRTTRLGTARGRDLLGP